MFDFPESFLFFFYLLERHFTFSLFFLLIVFYEWQSWKLGKGARNLSCRVLCLSIFYLNPAPSSLRPASRVNAWEHSIFRSDHCVVWSLDAFRRTATPRLTIMKIKVGKRCTRAAWRFYSSPGCQPSPSPDAGRVPRWWCCHGILRDSHNVHRFILSPS